MSITVIHEQLENLQSYYGDSRNQLRWPSVFVLPGWLEAWWGSFGQGYDPLVLAVKESGETIGIAPLKLKGGVASIIGDNSVCDYLDFIVAPSREEIFTKALLDYLKVHGITSLILETLRPDSIAGHNVAEEAKRRNYEVACSPIDVSFEMTLPSTWEDYLASLESKQRRDVERKMRKLEAVAPTIYSVLQDGEVSEADLSLFFQVMSESRRDKAGFLTAEMRGFFTKLSGAMSPYGLLRLGFLDVGKARVAGILYFDYGGRIYLYNSGYQPQFADLNVGIVSKLYCIRDAIQRKNQVFDFLKGPEVYKSQLGGREIALSSCSIRLGK